jgi:hypothetical protein
MPDSTCSSELWLLRTYFGSDGDTAWTSLTELARTTRPSVSGAALVISSDRTQCHERIRQVVARMATRAEANDGLYVALADKQTLMRRDRMLLTIDCAAVPHNAERVPTTRMAPLRAFRLGMDEPRHQETLTIEPHRISASNVSPFRSDVDRTDRDIADFTTSVADAINASLHWRKAMARDGSYG